MDEVFSKKPSEGVFVARAATDKLDAATDIRTLRQLVTMTIAEANTRFGREIYLEILEALNFVGMGFEMTDEEVEAWKPGDRM